MNRYDWLAHSLLVLVMMEGGELYFEKHLVKRTSCLLEAERWAIPVGWGGENAPLWALGFEIMMLVDAAAGGERSKTISQQRERLSAALEWHLRNHRYVSHLQLALAYMALGEQQKTIEALRKACDDGDPFMAFLHVWPIFDGLRKNEDFKALVAPAPVVDNPRADKEAPL